MIEFSRHQLNNGLTIIVHEDHSTPMAALNVLYKVGSKNESPNKTGFAHLFEHLMFGGSSNVPNFDEPLQYAGGESNAFTNNDITNFYDILPANNLETAFWLESDRMMNLNFSKKSLNVQRKVVIEEFKETCLNQPYGDVWHTLMEMAYKKHPYRWPVIGSKIKHIKDAKLEDVRSFFYKHYRPNNAVLVVAGAVKTEDVLELAEKWFGEIESGEIAPVNIPTEPPQEAPIVVHAKKKVPLDSLYLAFHMPGRDHEDYYKIDLLSDVLCNGSSSRLFRRLKKEQQLFSEIDCYITGNVDPGLFIIEGKPSPNTTLAEAEAAIWEQIDLLIKEQIPTKELQKIKNKVESSLIFSESTILNKAINLAFFELLGDAEIINKEPSYYQEITCEDIQSQAKKILTKDNCSVLWYEKID